MQWQDLFLFVTTNKIAFLMMVGVLIGMAIGGGLKTIEKDLTPRKIMYIGFASEILIQILEAIGIPLMIISLSIVFASLEKGVSKFLRLQVLLLCLFTKIFAAASGIIFTSVVKPGKGHERSKEIPTMSAELYLPFTIEEDHILDIVRNMFPENWVLTSVKRTTTEITHNITSNEFSFGLKNTEPLNLLGLMSISIVIGISMRMVKQSFQALMDFLNSALNVLLIMFRWIFYLTPVLLISLTAHEIIRIGPVFFIAVIGLYLAVWLICVIVNIIILYPLLYVIFVQKNPFVLYKQLGKIILAALRTSSTREISDSFNASLKEDCELNPRIVDYVQPLALLLNKDGSCLQFAISYILIAQYSGYDLHGHHYFSIAYFSIMGSMAVVGVPQGTVMLIAGFLRGLNMSTLGICVLFAMDWATNRFVTSLNMIGTAFATAILDRLNRNRLLQKETDIDKEENLEEEEPGVTEVTEEEA